METKNSNLVAPSLLASDFAFLARELKKVEEAGGDWAHLDVMDGHFVPNLTFGPPLIAALRPHTSLFFDVHLMIERPGDLLDEYVQAGADALTFHWEAEVHHHNLITRIQSLGKKAGISLVPSTPIESLLEILPLVDIVLVMSVNPGFGGQKYLPSSTGRIAKLRELREKNGWKYQISVDGGINSSTFLEAREGGADILVTGSAFFNAPDPAAFVRQLKTFRRS